jgi:hypothetical protein
VHYLDTLLRKSDLEMSDSDSDAPLTAAELLRRAAGNAKASPAAQKPKAPPAAQADDIDEEIRRLEAELEGSSSSSSSDDDTDGEDNESSGNKSSGPAVLSLSAMKDERIEALPASHLPSNKKRTMKIDRSSEQKGPTKKLKVSSGLEVAVKELLAGYVARSSEKMPFYCRVCAKQYANEPEFKEHRETEFHKKAVEMERKATYCKLCRKQLTSPAQMKEHLTSRPHKQHLDKVRSNQRQATQARGGNSQRRQWS